jgi:hypothetical protein
MVADEKKQKGGNCAAFYKSARLFVQIGADGDVAATFLPLAGNGSTSPLSSPRASPSDKRFPSCCRSCR